MAIVRTALNFAALWGNWLLGFLLIFNLLCLCWSWKKQSGAGLLSRLNQTRKSWAFQGVFSACLGLFVLNGPMAPLTRTVGQFQSHQGKPAPEFEFRTVSEDKPAKVSDFKGRVVLINFWATWCPPCVQELPTLDRLQAAYQSKGLTVLALSDETRERLKPFLEKQKIQLMGGYAKEFPGYRMEGFRPFTLLIDREGRLQKHLFGTLDYETFESLVRPLL